MWSSYRIKRNCALELSDGAPLFLLVMGNGVSSMIILSNIMNFNANTHCHRHRDACILIYTV